MEKIGGKDLLRRIGNNGRKWKDLDHDGCKEVCRDDIQTLLHSLWYYKSLIIVDESRIVTWESNLVLRLNKSR